MIQRKDKKRVTETQFKLLQPVMARCDRLFLEVRFHFGSARLIVQSYNDHLAQTNNKFIQHCDGTDQINCVERDLGTVKALGNFEQLFHVDDRDGTLRAKVTLRSV